MPGRPGRGFNFASGIPTYCVHMNQWQSPKREPPKTKAEMREMLAEAVLNLSARPRPREIAAKGGLTHI
jgi:hypothetical protein